VGAALVVALLPLAQSGKYAGFKFLVFMLLVVEVRAWEHVHLAQHSYLVFGLAEQLKQL
jgi:hypothetical protein